MDDSGVEARTRLCWPGATGRVGESEAWDRRSEYLDGFGSVGGALLYSALFVPELIEVEGCVFLRDVGWKGVGWDEVAAEAVCGQLHLFNDRDGFDGAPDGLAEVPVQAWRARLRDLFPDRRFVVRVMTLEETGGTAGLGFEIILDTAT